jgi:asparagine synthetase B (glutamine-hydrolysing)
MFFFAVTRQSIARGIDAPSVREFPMGDWVVTAATDDWLSSSDAGPDEVTVREAPPFAHARGGRELLFAEARFSSKDQTVELYKAPLGGRHFYYHVARGGGVYCASHADLLRAAGVPLEEDPQRLPEFFTYRYLTAPRTLFKGVDQMQAGERLRFAFDGDAWRRKPCELFSPPRSAADGDGVLDSATSDGRYGAYGERAADALRDALEALRPAGERPHVLLSGGLDSSILFELAQRELGVDESHSASYPFEPEAEDVEQRYALTAAEALGARHRFFVPNTGQFLRGFLEAAAAMEEPVVHLQSVLMLLMLRDGMPSDRGAVVMGEGADGAFGLKMHAKVRKLDLKGEHFRRWRPVLGLRPVLGALRPVSRAVGRGGDLVQVMESRWDVGDPVSDPRHVLWWMHVVCDREWVRRRFGATFEDVTATRASVIKPFQGRPVYDLISMMSFFSDAAMVQRQWSRLAEAAGKWAYYPFHARGVLESAYSTPWDVKLVEPKGVLRGVARRIGIPEFIIDRPKADFSANAKRWAAPGGVLDPLIPIAARAWDEREIRQMQSAYAASNDMPSAYTFLAILNYAVWKRLFLNREPLGALMEELERSRQHGERAAGAAVVEQPLPLAAGGSM